MRKLIKKWLGIDELENQMSATSAAVDKANQTLEDVLDSVVTLEESAASEKQRIENRANSKEPWVTIASSEYDKTTGLRIELDWNDAFVKTLRESGIEGSTDDIVVQQWLALLYEDLSRDMKDTADMKLAERGADSHYE